MKKFLAVFDGYKLSVSTMNYAIQFSQAAGAHLIGVFLDEFVYRSYDLYNVLKNTENPFEEIKKLDDADKIKRDKAVKLFEDTCSKQKIAFSVHIDKKIALQELKLESMFADMIVIGADETFNKSKEQTPSSFIKELLPDVQCPVMVVPKSFKLVDKVVLLYDGQPASLYAIKMFSYLFSNLLNQPVEVFYVKEGRQGNHLPNNTLMKEFIKRHFPRATFAIAKGNPEEQIPGHLRDHKQNEIVVLGAYRRTELSRWFKTSMADVLMRELDTPLFIAHNK